MKTIMASVRQTSRTKGKGKTGSNPPPSLSSSKKRKINEERQPSPPILDESFDNSLDSSRIMTDDSDSLGLETVEVEEEVDVTEELIVSIEDDPYDGYDDVVEEEQVESEVLFDPLLEVQTVTYAPGGDLVSEEVTTTENATTDKPGPAFAFKVPNFVHSSKGPGGNKRTRVWKNLKQITTAERSAIKDQDIVTYGSIDSPPSFKPAKKYSDISGLEARYTDPQTKMRYSNTDEFQRLRLLPGDIISGCLTLRKANVLVP